MGQPVSDLEERLEAEDGVVEVDRIMPLLTFPWAALEPGPRRWAPTDLSVEIEDEQLTIVRLTYRTVGDRAVVVAGARSEVDVDWLAERLSTPLLFAHFRRMNAGLPPAAVMSALEVDAVWDEGEADGWRLGHCGVGARPVRLAHMAQEEGHLLVASHGVAAEEASTLLSSLVPLAAGGEAAYDLHVRHRRALAQRWWDAPRTPWTPKD